jgi:hypothetical protein
MADVNLTIDDIKIIVHGLKMNSFSYIEPNAFDEIKFMIKGLPQPEEIDKMTQFPHSIKVLQEQIGKIMRLIELYGKRDMEFLTRYKARTSLPPRYKVLDWRVPMTTKANLIKNLVKLSCQLDEDHKGKLAQGLIDCCKKIQKDEIPAKELFAITKEIVACNDGLRKEAQQTIDLDFSDISNGLQNVLGWLADVEKKVIGKFNVLQRDRNPKSEGFTKQLQQIWNQVKWLSSNTKKDIEQINQITQAVQQDMSGSVPDNVYFNQKNTNVKVQWSEPDSEGYQSAFVEVDGQKYDVQRDESSNKITFKKVNNPSAEKTESTIEKPAPQPQAQPQAEEKPIEEVVPEKESNIQAEQPFNKTQNLKDQLANLNKFLSNTTDSNEQAKLKGLIENTQRLLDKEEKTLMPNQKVYFTSKDGQVSEAEFVEYVKQVNPRTQKEENYAKIRLENGGTRTVSPQRLTTSEPVIAFNLSKFLRNAKK